MVNLDGLEKVIAKTKLQSQKMADQIEALNSKLESFILELRAYRASPPISLPTFDGSDAIAWLARAEQYFLVSKIPPENRLSVAMMVLAGPALPWIQLLMRRIPTLSWDRFTQEMMNRFGDTIPQESRVPCNSSKHSSEGPIAAVHDAKKQPKIPPTPHNNTASILPIVTTPLLSSSPSTTTQQENTLHACPPNSAKQNFADLHASTNSAVVSSLFPLAAMASMNPHDEVPFAALPPAPQPHLHGAPLLVVPPSAVAPAPLLHSSPLPQPQPQFVTAPKLSCVPMPPPLPQQQLFPTQSRSDVPHPPPQKVLFQPPRLYPLSSSQQLLKPIVFRLLVQLGKYGNSDPCCLSKSSLLALVGFQWFYTRSSVHKLEFEPPPKLSCANSKAALRARLFRQ